MLGFFNRLPLFFLDSCYSRLLHLYTKYDETVKVGAMVGKYDRKVKFSILRKLDLISILYLGFCQWHCPF